jgi:ATP-dependent protease ClpP protease subunit
MITIPISGIIAGFQFEEESNVTPVTLKKSLDAANGQDVLITINSPGGSVFHGLEMFSLIKNYSGHVETRVISLAASMGSILALAGNKKSIENTAMYFIHNAQGVGMGDYREMDKTAKWLKDISSLLANLYAEHTNLSVKEAQKLMDEDTQFFGDALTALGFENIDTGITVNNSIARVEAVKRIADINAKLPSAELLNDLEKVAASIAVGKKTIDVKHNSAHNTQIETAESGNIKNMKGVIMNLDELKAQYPDLCNQLIQAGVEKERKRVTAHLKMGENFNAMKQAVAFIADGKSVLDEDVHAEYIVASANKTAVTDRLEDGETVVTPPSGQVDEDAQAEAFAKELSARAGGKK